MKAAAAMMAVAMTCGLTPASAFAVTGSQVAADGTYTATANVVNPAPDEDEWDDYSVDVAVTVSGGKIAGITATDAPADSASYLAKAVSKKKGISTLLTGQEATEDTVNSWDAVSGATIASAAVKSAAAAALNSAPEAAAPTATPEPTTVPTATPEPTATPAPTATPEPTATPTPEEDEYVYGTANLSYADFYYGELNDVAESDTMDLAAEDKVAAAGMCESGQYDAVSSATNSDRKSHGYALTYWENDGTTGTLIEGVKDVGIRVSKSLYDQAKEAIANGKACNNQLLTIIGSMTVSDTPLTEYKVLNGDGTLGAMVTETTASDATATITTNTKYGNYQIDVNGTVPDVSEIEGVVLETTDGAKYGLEHLENIWLKPAELAFAAESGVVSHGRTIDCGR